MTGGDVRDDQVDLNGKVALVTGAARGIGAMSAERLAQAGAVVVGADVDDEQGRITFERLGKPHSYQNLDVADGDRWRAVVDQVLEEHGRLDILHLNAGVMSRPPEQPMFDDALEWFTADAYRKVRRVNLDGVVLGLVEVLGRPELHPRVLVTSSAAALMPFPQDPFYAASKSALLTLAVSLQPLLLPRGMRIDAILPGAVDTDILAPDVRATFPLDSASFIADAVIHVLASENATTNLWLALSEQDGVRPYELPGLAIPS